MSAKRPPKDPSEGVRHIALPVTYCALRKKPPPFATRSKLSSAQARGKTYERKVIKALKRLIDTDHFHHDNMMWVGPWIDFADANGPGLAQPDAIIALPHRCLIIEVKLKQSPRAEVQLVDLYRPLVMALWPHLEPPALLEVFKFPSCDKSPQWVEGPDYFLANPSEGVHYWHYIP